MISRKTVKSKASKVQPNQAAHQAYHWSLVGSFHHGMLFTVSTAAIVHASSANVHLKRAYIAASHTQLAKPPSDRRPGPFPSSPGSRGPRSGKPPSLPL